jgi:hypothetical protein
MHKFFKRSFSEQTLPSNIAPTTWDRLSKRAHHIWDMNVAGDEIEAVRKHPDTVQASAPTLDNESNEINVGDLVLLYMGGRRLEARILDTTDAGLSLVTDDGYVEGIPANWVKKSQMSPQQLERSRKPTRDDIPVQQEQPARPNQQPAQPQPAQPPANNIVSDLEYSLNSHGGHAAVQLDSTGATILELKQSGQGISATLWRTSTAPIHSGQYKSVADAVSQLSIRNVDADVPVEFLRTQK